MHSCAAELHVHDRCTRRLTQLAWKVEAGRLLEHWAETRALIRATWHKNAHLIVPQINIPSKTQSRQIYPFIQHSGVTKRFDVAPSTVPRENPHTETKGTSRALKQPRMHLQSSAKGNPFCSTRPLPKIPPWVPESRTPGETPFLLLDRTEGPKRSITLRSGTPGSGPAAHFHGRHYYPFVTE